MTESENGTLRYAWTWDQVYVDSIQLDELDGHDGTIYYLYFEITDNLLVYKDFPWSFCPTNIDMMKRDNPNLNGEMMLDKNPTGCRRLQGVNVIPTD